MFVGLKKLLGLVIEGASAADLPKERTPQTAARYAYNRSDSGRMFGWWAVLDGWRVAELDYLSWDFTSPYWHEYRLTILDSAAQGVLLDADKWRSCRVLLESRFIPGYFVANSLAQVRRFDRIAIGAAELPASVLEDPRLDYGSFRWVEELNRRE